MRSASATAVLNPSPPACTSTTAGHVVRECVGTARLRPGLCRLVAGTTLCECVTAALTAGIPFELLCRCHTAWSSDPGCGQFSNLNRCSHGWGGGEALWNPLQLHRQTLRLFKALAAKLENDDIWVIFYLKMKRERERENKRLVVKYFYFPFDFRMNKLFLCVRFAAAIKKRKIENTTVNSFDRF